MRIKFFKLYFQQWFASRTQPVEYFGGQIDCIHYHNRKAWNARIGTNNGFLLCCLLQRDIIWIQPFKRLWHASTVSRSIASILIFLFRFLNKAISLRSELGFVQWCIYILVCHIFQQNDGSIGSYIIITNLDWKKISFNQNNTLAATKLFFSSSVEALFPKFRTDYYTQ